MSTNRILLIHPTIRKVGVDILKASAQVVLAPDGREPTLIRELAASRADAMIVRVESATRAIFECSPDLKVVGMHGVGTDAIDVEAATQAGILVLNAPKANFKSTAEHTVALMMAVAKNLCRGDEAVRAGEFTSFRNTHLPMELEGRSIFIVGLGRIGSEVARKCGAAFNMRVMSYDPLYDRNAMALKEVEWMSMSEGLATADFVSVHVPLTPQTRGMMNAAAFAQMKPGAVFLNIARGPVMAQSDLIDALLSGHLLGAGLDVFEDEPIAASDPLTRLPNVVLSPHYGGDTVTARDRCSATIARSVLSALSGRVADGIVNLEVLQADNFRLRSCWAA